MAFGLDTGPDTVVTIKVIGVGGGPGTGDHPIVAYIDKELGIIAVR